MATGQPSTRLIMMRGGGRSEIHKQLFVNKDQSSPELFYSFSVNTLKDKVFVSTPSMLKS